jgi:hypothetical protein
MPIANPINFIDAVRGEKVSARCHQRRPVPSERVRRGVGMQALPQGGLWEALMGDSMRYA